jgi:hypothetical protein
MMPRKVRRSKLQRPLPGGFTSRAGYIIGAWSVSHVALSTCGRETGDTWTASFAPVQLSVSRALPDLVDGRPGVGPSAPIPGVTAGFELGGYHVWRGDDEEGACNGMG